MSLIVTSSAKQDETTQLGISIPYQYRNHIKNPLTIPPNSEVAVESVKIQRVPMLDYGNSIRSNFWFGERLTSNASLDEQTSYFIPVRNEILGSNSPQDFAQEFKVMLQEAYSFHPEIDSVKIEVEIAVDSDGDFKGFQYKIPQVGSVGTSSIPPAGTLLQEISNVTATWDGTSITEGGVDGGDCFVQLLPQGTQGGPISHNNGSLTYKTGKFNTGTVVYGLSRPYCFDPVHQEIQGWIGNSMAESGADTDHPFSLAILGEGRGEYGDVYMDYCVEDNGVDIRVYNYCSDVDGLGRMQEVVYYNKAASASSIDNTPNSSYASNSPLASSQMGDVTFTVKCEKVEISISGTVVVAVNDFSSASFKSQIPMPTSISNWKMYPTVYFSDGGDSVDITNYTSRDSTTIHRNFPENSWITRTKIPVFLDGRGAEVKQETIVKGGGNQTRQPPWNNSDFWDGEIYSLRPIMHGMSSDGTAISDESIRNYKGVSNNLMGGHTDGYENIFIMGQNERYLDGRSQVWQPNSAGVLGFTPFSINQDSGMTHGGGYHGASFVSSTKPSLTSQQSTFIRVPTLTHETYNFSTGNPSKILFSIPRFDNSGAEVGSLYFQNNDKTFIDLKNSAPLQLTDLDIQLVRKDETFAKDLTGSTEVVFFVRPKM